MIVTGVCSTYLLELTQGIHLQTDEYRVALYTRDAELTPDTAVYQTRAEVTPSFRDQRGDTVDTGYRAGGQVLTGYRAALENHAVLIFWQDPVWPVSTITARGALVYNYSKGNRAVAALDLGKDYISTNGRFTIGLPKPVIQIGG